MENVWQSAAGLLCCCMLVRVGGAVSTIPNELWDEREGSARSGLNAKSSLRLAVIPVVMSVREETQRLESIYQRKLAALDELKKSLLHQAFSGRL